MSKGFNPNAIRTLLKPSDVPYFNTTRGSAEFTEKISEIFQLANNIDKMFTVIFALTEF